MPVGPLSVQFVSATNLMVWVPGEPLVTHIRSVACEIVSPASDWRLNFM
jgi:hypothetical protein